MKVTILFQGIDEALKVSVIKQQQTADLSACLMLQSTLYLNTLNIHLRVPQFSFLVMCFFKAHFPVLKQHFTFVLFAYLALHSTQIAFYALFPLNTLQIRGTNISDNYILPEILKLIDIASPVEMGVAVQNLILVPPLKVESIKFRIVFNGEMKVESVIRIPKQLLKTSHYHIFIHCEKNIGSNIERK